MDQASRIKELNNIQLKPKEIKAEIDIEFGQHALKMPAIYKHLREVKFTQKTYQTKEEPRRHPDEQLMIRIQHVLNEEPTFSVRNIADTLKENQSTIHLYLTKYICLNYKHCTWAHNSKASLVKIIEFCLKEFLNHPIPLT